MIDRAFEEFGEKCADVEAILRALAEEVEEAAQPEPPPARPPRRIATAYRSPPPRITPMARAHIRQRRDRKRAVE